MAADRDLFELGLGKETTRNLRQSERRRLNRIRHFFSNELRCILHMGGLQYGARVIDFHCAGMRLELLRPDIALKELCRIEVKYGKATVAEISDAAPIWKVGKELGISLNGKLSGNGKRKGQRYQIKDTFSPTVLATAVTRLKYPLHFSVTDLSFQGMRIQTSLSNKHLLTGMTLNSSISLPGVCLMNNLNLQIKHCQIINDRLSMGTQFVNASAENLKSFAQFAVFGSITSSPTNEKLKCISREFGRIRSLGSCLHIENLSDDEDWLPIQEIRRSAYTEAGIVDSTIGISDMRDEYDARSIVIVAKIDGTVAGTVRLIRCDATTERFMFEEYISAEKLDRPLQRDTYLEISRLAIAPEFQNADIVVRLFEEIARQIILNGKAAICLARKSQRTSYGRAGFKVISREIPHPLLTDETLAVMTLHKEQFVSGSTLPALSWDVIARDVVENLRYAGLVAGSRGTVRRLLRRPLERGFLNFSRNQQKLQTRK